MHDTRARGTDGYCSTCGQVGHRTWELDACPAMEPLRKPEPAPDPQYRCVHCGISKHQDDFTYYTVPGKEVCTRCLKGGPDAEPLGDGAEELLP